MLYEMGLNLVFSLTIWYNLVEFLILGGEVKSMCKSCGCGPKKEATYKCEECGKVSSTPKECCGKPMKKVE